MGVMWSVLFGRVCSAHSYRFRPLYVLRGIPVMSIALAEISFMAGWLSIRGANIARIRFRYAVLPGHEPVNTPGALLDLIFSK